MGKTTEGVLMVGTEANSLKVEHAFHAVGIKFKDGTQWGMLFNNAKSAETAFNLLRPATDRPPGAVEAIDDYGMRVSAMSFDISGVFLQDLAADADGTIERTLIQARMQARAQTRANSDPALRSAAMFQGDMHRMNGSLRS